MKVKEVFEKSVQFLRDRNIESPRLETELLIASVLKTDRIGIYLKYEAPLTELEVSSLRELIVRKSKGEPTAYLLGEKCFYNRVFKVGSGVLIPRPETEMIVEEVVSQLPKMKCAEDPQVVDWGAGSGCIGLSIGLEYPKAHVTLVERSSEAFLYCRQNYENLVGLEDRKRFQLLNGSVEDWSCDKRMDVIVGNPPYIDPRDPDVAPMVKQFEPPEALFSDKGGLQTLSSWLDKAVECLAPEGHLYFEIGHKQGPEVLELFKSRNVFCNVEILKDFNKRDRIVKAVKNG